MWFQGDFENPHPSGSDLYDTRRNARLSVEDAARLVGRHRTSYKNQETGRARVDLAVYRLIEACAGWLPDRPLPVGASVKESSGRPRIRITRLAISGLSRCSISRSRRYAQNSPPPSDN